MSKAFFLTHQTTNLMEGFARDLQAQAGLFLIYGDEGIGKTRLLEELAQTRLKNSRVRWMDLKAGSSGDGALVDSSVMIEKIFARAKPGDIIVADHFEMALKKTRHQLFLSWSTDGVDKQLSMIIAANTDYFNELRQLSQQYQIRVQSFQQLPFNDDEVAAFLGFYLFPNRSIAQITIPPLLCNQLSLAQGRVGKIVEIAERAGDQITSLPMNDNESIKQSSRVIVGVLIAVAIVVVTGWYFINSKVQIDEIVIAEPGSPLVGQPLEMPLSLKSEVDTDEATDEGEVVAVATEGMTDAVFDSTTFQSTDAPSSDAENALFEPVTPELPEAIAVVPAGSMNDAEDSDTETPLPEPVAQLTTTQLTSTEEVQPLSSSAADGLLSNQTQAQQLQEGNVVDDGKVTNTLETSADRVAVSEIIPSGYSSSSVALSLSDQLRRDLQTSFDWIKGRDSSVGTLQILLLSQKRFQERVYYEYLDKLAGEGVDLAELKIFETYTGNQRVFSVVFGEYPNRRSAAASKTELPKILRDTSPVPRSVGGLMEEMQRLADQN